MRCAIYTRKSSDERLDAEYSSLDNQRAFCSAYIMSQAGEGWTELPDRYDDGGFSGGTLERPALDDLRSDIAAGRIDMVVVYKIDRLSRSLRDFANLVAEMEKIGVTFVSVTQSFNTANAMGRLTLNVLLSFAQFEREMTGERLTDWFAGARARGIWCSGPAPMGYRRGDDGRLIVNQQEAETVRYVFRRYPHIGSVRYLAREVNALGHLNNRGRPFNEGAIQRILKNRVYLGDMPHHRGAIPGPHHEAIIDPDSWRRAQKTLANVERRNSARIREPVRFMLQGLIFGPGGYAMLPHFGYGRNGQIYRYYVARPQRQTGMPCPVGRLRAPEIEQAIVVMVQQMVGMPGTKAAATEEALAGTVRRIVARIDARVDDMTITLVTGAVFQTATIGRTLEK